MNIETAEVKQEETETPFLRVWNARDEAATQEVSEYLGCGCNLALVSR
jgi:hypothetical protein